MFHETHQGNRLRHAVRYALFAGTAEEIRAVSVLVTTLSKSGDGSLLIETDNGQVWRQEGSAELMLAVGDVVVISRAAMSSFRLSTPTKRHARVKRVK